MSEAAEDVSASALRKAFANVKRNVGRKRLAVLFDEPDEDEPESGDEADEEE